MAETEAAARRIVEILRTGDFDAIAGAVDEEYVDHQGLGNLAIRGQDGFRQVVAALQENAEVRVAIEDLVAGEDRAALRLRWDLVTRAGESSRRATLDLLRFRDGRLVEHWGTELL